MTSENTAAEAPASRASLLPNALIGLSFLVDAILAEKGPQAPETLAAISEILLIARVDTAVLGLVIVDMVTKPFS